MFNSFPIVYGQEISLEKLFELLNTNEKWLVKQNSTIQKRYHDIVQKVEIPPNPHFPTFDQRMLTMIMIDVSEESTDDVHVKDLKEIIACIQVLEPNRYTHFLMGRLSEIMHNMHFGIDQNDKVHILIGITNNICLDKPLSEMDMMQILFARNQGKIDVIDREKFNVIKQKYHLSNSLGVFVIEILTDQIVTSLQFYKK